jgi:hypothetical protein
MINAKTVSETSASIVKGIMSIYIDLSNTISMTACCRSFVAFEAQKEVALGRDVEARLVRDKIRVLRHDQYLCEDVHPPTTHRELEILAF